MIRHGVYNHVVCAFPFDFFCAAHRVGGQQQNDCTGWTKEEDDANGFVDVAPSAERNKTHTKKESTDDEPKTWLAIDLVSSGKKNEKKKET